MMDETSRLVWQRYAAWCGPLFVLTFVVCWGWIGMNLPPAGPDLSAMEIARHYADNSLRIRIGFVLSVVLICLYMPWTAVLSARLARIEGRGPMLSYLQLIGGALTVMVVSMSAAFWIGAAFRPTRNPEITQMLHDMGWLTIDQLYFCTTLQMIAAAIVGLHDKSAQPMLPRWACWYAIWAGFTFLPASLTAFIKVGPFAWNGVMSYYFPYFTWLSWFSIFAVYMLKAIANDRTKAGAAGQVLS
jgi:hypothetical protein